MLNPDSLEKDSNNQDYQDHFLPASFCITIRKIQNHIELGQNDMKNNEAAIRDFDKKIADGEAVERFEDDAVKIVRRLIFDGLVKREPNQTINEFTLATVRNLRDAVDKIKNGTMSPDDPILKVLEAWARISAESLVGKIRKDITDYQANVIKGPWDGS